MTTAAAAAPLLYRCEVRHVRTGPVRYRLRHRTSLWLVDLDRLPRLSLVACGSAGTEAIDDGMARVQMLAEDWAPFPDRPDDRVDLRLQGQPEITPQGVALTLCPVVRLGLPRIDAAVPG